ncbi:MAG TPA: tetratricopeptide repeat protein, partial [Chloroflexia bacterium]|nr:tetratricopeptide repeat protein [Chloroflexia bacterium]
MIDPASRHLGQLDQAGLIQRADTHPELEYLFRHALIQDAAYTSLLRSDRRRLHRAVAEALEGLYPDRQAALAPVLAQHFHAAEAGARALHYYTLAGDQALQQHALPEAVALYTQALDLAAADPAAALPLYHARGQALERLGAFERARADHETALELARTCVDPRAEWQALLDLGLLWSERDYAQAGTYFQQAVTQAGALSDPAPLAHSLNRLGNWHLNHEQPDPALRYHRDALALFQNLGDQAGIATTLDLLGMTNALSGDVVQSVYYYEPAIVLFQDLDDRPMLISSLAILAIRGGNYEYDTVLPVPSSAAAMHQEGERAIRLAQQIGWRAGEAYAWFVLGYGLGPWGEYTSALQAAQRGLALAEEIGHRQWACAAHWTLGAIYYDLLAVPRARPHLEQAVALGQALDSPYWTRLAVALQADCSVLEQDLPQAARLLA